MVAAPGGDNDECSKLSGLVLYNHIEVGAILPPAAQRISSLHIRLLVTILAKTLTWIRYTILAKEHTWEEIDSVIAYVISIYDFDADEEIGKNSMKKRMFHQAYEPVERNQHERKI